MLYNPTDEEIIKWKKKVKSSRKSEVKVISKTKPKFKAPSFKPPIINPLIDWFISDEGTQVTPSPIENIIRTIINSFNIDSHIEVSFKGLNPTGAIKGNLRFDFWIPSRSILIEYDGKGYHKSKDQNYRDNIKNTFCKINNLKLIRLTKDVLPNIEVELYKLLQV